MKRLIGAFGVLAGSLAISTATLVQEAVPASASGTHTVNTTTDTVDAAPSDGICADVDGACSLRAAIQTANQSSDADTIVLAPGAIYGLTLPSDTGVDENAAASGDLDITSPITLTGNGAAITASVLDADGTGPAVGARIFHIAGSTASASISSVILTGGSASSGGAILAEAPIILDRSVLATNRATNSGGGLFLGGPATGSQITQSVFLNNTAAKGGGLRLNSGTATVSWSTFSLNTATTAGYGHGLLVNTDSILNLNGTILDDPAGATECKIAGAAAGAAAGILTSGGNNLYRDTTCFPTNTTTRDQAATAADLGTNGTLFTIYPSATSPAVDTAGTTCPATDQAGHGRPRQHALCDKGAIEQWAPMSPTSVLDVADESTADGICKTPAASPAAGACTFRAAVQQANHEPGPDTIVLAPGAIYGLTLPSDTGVDKKAAASGDLDITSPITLTGNGAAITASVLDADGTGPAVGARIFHIAGSTASASISSVILTGGSASSGGAILAEAPIILDRSVLATNRATNSGGGLFLGGPATGSQITQSVFLNNTAAKGGGLRLNSGTATVSWSTFSLNTATTAGYGHGLLVNTDSILNLNGTILDDPAGATECKIAGAAAGAAAGILTSGGNNLSRDTTCFPTNTTTRDQAATAAGLGTNGTLFTIYPSATSPAVDTADLTCPATDQAGSVRPVNMNCDKGAIEYFDPLARDGLTRWAAVNVPLVTAPGQPTTVATDDVENALGELYASYLIGDEARADVLVDAIDALSDNQDFPGASTDWPWRFSIGKGQLALSVIPRLFTSNQPHSWIADPDDPQRRKVLGWFQELVDDGCDVADEFPDGDVWKTFTGADSENFQFSRRYLCLMALYLTGDQSDLDSEWAEWANLVERFIGESARTGIFHEVNSSSYVATTLGAVVNLAEFPGDQGLRDNARNLMDLYWHDLAQNYNAVTKVAGVGGVRHYGPGPVVGATDPFGASTRYYNTENVPQQQIAALYGWRSDWPSIMSAIGRPRFAVLQHMSSTYRPLELSRQLATDPTKDYSYTSLRPRRVLGTNGQRTHIVRNVTVNDDYIIGGQTFGYVDENGSPIRYVNEDIIYDIALNNDPHERIVVSAVGERKDAEADSYASLNAINGTVQGDALIASRDWHAEPTGQTNGASMPWGNARGVGVFVSGSALSNSLTLDTSGWYFAQSGNSYVAIRLADTPIERQITAGGAVIEKDLLLLDDDGTNDVVNDGGDCSKIGGGFNAAGCCAEIGDAMDCWAPIVVQMGRASEDGTFTEFKEAVTDPDPSDPSVPRYRPTVDTATGIVTNVQYTMLDGTILELSRQQTTTGEAAPSLPQVKTPTMTDFAPVDTAPTKAYRSDYIDMDWANDTNVTLWGPAGTSGPSEVRSFTFP